MRKDAKAAKAFIEKLDRLTEPEKALVLAYIKKALKDEKPKPRKVKNL